MSARPDLWHECTARFVNMKCCFTTYADNPSAQKNVRPVHVGCPIRFGIENLGWRMVINLFLGRNLVPVLLFLRVEGLGRACYFLLVRVGVMPPTVPIVFHCSLVLPDSRLTVETIYLLRNDTSLLYQTGALFPILLVGLVYSTAAFIIIS